VSRAEPGVEPRGIADIAREAEAEAAKGDEGGVGVRKREAGRRGCVRRTHGHQRHLGRLKQRGTSGLAGAYLDGVVVTSSIPPS